MRAAVTIAVLYVTAGMAQALADEHPARPSFHCAASFGSTFTCEARNVPPDHRPIWRLFDGADVVSTRKGERLESYAPREWQRLELVVIAVDDHGWILACQVRYWQGRAIFRPINSAK